MLHYRIIRNAMRTERLIENIICKETKIEKKKLVFDCLVCYKSRQFEKVTNAWWYGFMHAAATLFVVYSIRVLKYSKMNQPMLTTFLNFGRLIIRFL